MLGRDAVRLHRRNIPDSYPRGKLIPDNCFCLANVLQAGTACGIAGLLSGTIIVLVAGPIALDRISWKFYYVLIFPVAVELVCVYLFFPETKQRSLEDIAEAFGDKVRPQSFRVELPLTQ